MYKILSLIELRFLILKITKESNKKITIDELIDKLPVNYFPQIEDISKAVCELNSFGLLQVQYKENFNASCIPIKGHAIVNLSF